MSTPRLSSLTVSLSRSAMQCQRHSQSVFTRRATLATLRTPSSSRTTTTPHHPITDSPSSPALSNSVPLDSTTMLSRDAAAPQTAARPPAAPKVEKPRPKLRSTKAALTMTSTAVSRLRNLLNGPTPQLIRVGVRNKGCAGMSYHLEYVETPGKFDEIVEQDGVRVLIDSKALFSIIGSEMDWKEDSLSSKFVFQNPNIKDACGCGESFNVST